MSRKKKEGSVSLFKKAKDRAVYTPRYDGITGKIPSRRKPTARDSWLPEAIPDEAFFYGDDEEPQLSADERRLAQQISNARR